MEYFLVSISLAFSQFILFILAHAIIFFTSELENDRRKVEKSPFFKVRSVSKNLLIQNN